MHDPLKVRHLDRTGSYRQVQNVLRVIGPIVLAVGVLCMVIAFIDFVSAFGSFGGPTLFWLFFVGMPLLFVGGVMTSAGFAGAVARYQATQVAPVAKDTVNYMAEGTQDSIRTVASAVAEGLREGSGGQTSTEPMIRCHKCNTANQTGSKFCDQCGAALIKSVRCLACGELNDGDAKFCDTCGRPIGSPA